MMDEQRECSRGGTSAVAEVGGKVIIADIRSRGANYIRPRSYLA
jgi:hypothetical protein